MHPTRSRLTVPLLALATLAATLTAARTAQQAAASPNRKAQPTARIGIAIHGTGIALRGGATLAPPKVLDLGSDPVAISQVIEDQDGTERRQDTTAEVAFALQAEVLFAKDSARLSGSARSRIASIARVIDEQHARKVRIFGFTDNLGSFAHGEALSQQRATAVQAVLAGELHTRTVRFETRGLGEQHPVASNAGKADRQKNRRVEISYSRTGN
ncbi:OmpA family protein [Streptomyces sp. NPDC056821]|uniref:OmpA family protein n=1 Tax=unclassified Streptomyces TaxID=2593676 RepID=UPI0036D01EA2